MTRLIFDAFAGEDLDDPLAVALGELTDAFDREIRFDLMGDGSGEFSIDPDSPQAAWCAPGNYIRAKRSTDAGYIFGFVLDEKQDTLVSKNEQGGEFLHRGGRGSIAVAERARLLHTSHAGTSRITADGRWRWPAGIGTPGRVISEIIADAQARVPPAIPMFSHDFSAALDSEGAAWDAVDGDYELPIGQTSLLDAIDAERDRGTEFACSHDFALRAFREGGRGVDRSATVVFRKGVNIAESANVDGTYGPGSRVLVKGSSADGDVKFVMVTDAQTATLEGAASKVGRRELFLEHGTFATDADLIVAGQQHLKQSRAQYNGLFTIGVTHGSGEGDGEALEAAHYEPLTDYDVGDLVTLDIPGAYANTTHRLTAIVLRETAGGEDEVPDPLADPETDLQGGYEVTLELDGIPLRKSSVPAKPAVSEVAGATPGGTGEPDPGSVMAPTEEGAVIVLAKRGAVFDTTGDPGLYNGGLDDGGWGSGDWAGAAPMSNTAHSLSICNVGLGWWSNVGIAVVALTLTAPADNGRIIGAVLSIEHNAGDGDLGQCPGMGHGIGGYYCGDVPPVKGPFYVMGPFPGPPDGAHLGAGGNGAGRAIASFYTPAAQTTLEVPVPLSGLPYGQEVTYYIVPGFRCSAGAGCHEEVLQKGGFGDGAAQIDTCSAVAKQLTVGAQGMVLGVGAEPGGIQNGVNRTFTLQGGFSEVRNVYRNGLALGSDAFEADIDGVTVRTLGWAPAADDVVVWDYVLA